MPALVGNAQTEVLTPRKVSFDYASNRRRSTSRGSLSAPDARSEKYTALVNGFGDRGSPKLHHVDVVKDVRSVVQPQIPSQRPLRDLPLRHLTDGGTNGSVRDKTPPPLRSSEDTTYLNGVAESPISRLSSIVPGDTHSSLSGKTQLSLAPTHNASLTPVEEVSGIIASPSNQDGMLKVPDKHHPRSPTPPTAGLTPQLVPPYSPSQARQPPGRRRSSAQLVRRMTRSIASDLHLDDIPPDDDAARWAERIRQRRISSKRRREEEDDDRVVMGTKVDESHVNYVTAYNMLTGIRFCVSRTNAKLDRQLTDADFTSQHKFAFDVTGNELTPSSRYDFKFKDYAPWVFRHLRTIFRIDPADYLMSLTDKYILSELGSPGKSGSFFYFSRDYKYIIKTVHQSEAKFLRTILREYYNHVRANPNTLLSEFYGLHRVKIPYGRKIHFVVMNNLFPPHKDIHRTFDLKGSTIGRMYGEDQLAQNPRATLKDLNWLQRNMHLEFGPTKQRAFVEQMQRDVSLLRRLQIMDYSLLVGIHDLGRGNRENLRDKTLQVFEPGGEQRAPVLSGDFELLVSSAPPNQLTHARDSTLSRTPSKVETARKAKELRQLVQNERPVPMDQTGSRLPEEMLEEREGYFHADDGGFAATNEDDSAGEEIYYLGIIDCLTRVSLPFHMHHFVLSIWRISIKEMKWHADMHSMV